VTTQEQQVRDLLKSIETGDSGPGAVINPDKFVQHNVGVADGVAGFRTLVAQRPKRWAHVHTVRAFRDRDRVFAHTDYGPKVGFDIFRFEQGRIVEHWDNLQEKPETANPSGHSMLDGPTEAVDLNATAANKALVGKFVDDILVNGRMSRLAGYFNGDRYIQHNPQIADGLSGLGNALKMMAKQGRTMKYDRVHMVLGEGNFVLTVSEGNLGGRFVAFYDLFRVESSKIAEHWDTIEPVPPREEWKNANGKF
jgi:predicted SnoaL-like aldol condensation-catalyzing enzyme